MAHNRPTTTRREAHTEGNAATSGHCPRSSPMPNCNSTTCAAFRTQDPRSSTITNKPMKSEPQACWKTIPYFNLSSPERSKLSRSTQAQAPRLTSHLMVAHTQPPSLPISSCASSTPGALCQPLYCRACTTPESCGYYNIFYWFLSICRNHVMSCELLMIIGNALHLASPKIPDRDWSR